MTSLKPYVTAADHVRFAVIDALTKHVTDKQMLTIADALGFSDLFAMNHEPMFITPVRSLWNQAVANNKVNELMAELEKIELEHIDWCGT